MWFLLKMSIYNVKHFAYENSSSCDFRSSSLRNTTPCLTKEMEIVRISGVVYVTIP